MPSSSRRHSPWAHPPGSVSLPRSVPCPHPGSPPVSLLQARLPPSLQFSAWQAPSPPAPLSPGGPGAVLQSPSQAASRTIALVAVRAGGGHPGGARRLPAPGVDPAQLRGGVLIGYLVRGSGGAVYRVEAKGSWRCSCPDHHGRHRRRSEGSRAGRCGGRRWGRGKLPLASRRRPGARGWRHDGRRPHPPRGGALPALPL
jgi:hypothetical protein